MTSARAPSGPAAPRGAPLSGLPPGSCSEPRLVSPLLSSPAPSSYEESHFKRKTVNPTRSAGAASVVYGGIQQGSLFAKEYGKCRLNTEEGGAKETNGFRWGDGNVFLALQQFGCYMTKQRQKQAYEGENMIVCPLDGA